MPTTQGCVRLPGAGARMYVGTTADAARQMMPNQFCLCVMVPGQAVAAYVIFGGSRSSGGLVLSALTAVWYITMRLGLHAINGDTAMRMY